MILYNEHKQSIEINDDYSNNGLGFGECSQIYYFDNDKCVKIYYDDCLISNRINHKVYQILKEINSDYLVKFYDLLYEDISLNGIRGYIMKFYNNEKFKLLEKETDYNIYIFRELLTLFDILSDNNILVDDIKEDNTIFTEEKIIINDPDLFENVDKDCKQINRLKLIELFKNIYKNEMEQFIRLDYRFNPYAIISELFDDETNIIEGFQKKLKKYKYPKDYFINKE